MHYHTLDELPAGLQRTLPNQALMIYMESYNSAWQNYAINNNNVGSREEVAHRQAWGAVKRQFYKNFTNAWRRREEI